jgi:hypothetical protein
VRCEIDNAGKNPFGQVQEGLLTLKGVLKPLRRVRLLTPNIKAQPTMPPETQVVYLEAERCDFSPDELLDPDLDHLFPTVAAF